MDHYRQIALDQLLAQCDFAGIQVADMTVSLVNVSTTALFIALCEAGVEVVAHPFRAACAPSSDANSYPVEHAGFLLEIDGQLFDGLGNRSMDELHACLRKEWPEEMPYSFCRFMTQQDLEEVSTWCDEVKELFSGMPSFDREPDIADVFLPPAHAWVQSVLMDQSVPPVKARRSLRL